MHVCIIYHINKSKILLHLFIRLPGHKRLVNSLIYSGKTFLVHQIRTLLKNGVHEHILWKCHPSAATEAENDTGEVGPGDAVWILTSAFIIFTMISGFGLVESGEVNLKASIDLLTGLEAILTDSQPPDK